MAIAIRSVGTILTYGTRTNSTLVAPASIANGDILVAAIYTESNPTAPTPSAPGGWSTLGSTTSVTDPGGFNEKFSVWWKRCASESGNYTFTHASTTSNGVIVAYSGCLASGTPFGTPVDNTGSGTTSTGNSVTTTAANSWLLLESHSSAGGGITPPTGMTERVDSSGQPVYVADELIAAAGATGTRAFSNGNPGGYPWAVRMVEMLAATATIPNKIVAPRQGLVRAAYW